MKKINELTKKEIENLSGYEAQKEVCNGLSEVCKMLAKSTNLDNQKNAFLGYAKQFEKFAKIFNKLERRSK